jgi:hypothetical protein
MAGAHLRFEISLDQFLTDMVESAVSAVVKKGCKGSRAGLKSEISRALKKVLMAEMQISPACGSHIIGICSHSERFEPWSPEAKKLTSQKKEA